jgi:hypothetical protein
MNTPPTTLRAPTIPRVGLSLSLCVRQVLLGHLPEEDILYIVTNTAAPDKAGFSLLVSGYQRHYWRDDPERAAVIAWRLYKAGRIIQPKLLNPKYEHYTDVNTLWMGPGYE